jgi:tetratricopeptide (TPR) repeat protein
MPPRESIDTFTELPDPGEATTVDDLVERLRRLKVWAGNPSYEQITGRVAAGWTTAGRPAAEVPGKTTVVDCFRAGRRRLDADLVAAVVSALHPDAGYAAQWRQALRVIAGEISAAGQVRVQDRLPPDLAGFTGRTTELGRLRRALGQDGSDAGVVVISALAGMAGVGKTQLAVHLGHHLLREKRFDRVLFVNLRGFHPDPARPPADPAAVLDGFLRLLGVPGQQIPHGLTARAALYRDRLAGARALVVLDNAADAEQIRPLLPDAAGCPGCLVLVTSRRDLSDLPRPATHLAVDVFTPAEARQYLTRAAPGVPLGDDPDAVARIADRCGHLPLALGLVAGHIRAKPGWTLTDHADRLDEHHQHGRVETGVQVALDLSYQQLLAREQRLLRLVALHPGQDLDAYAAAALADTDLDTARTVLDRSHRDHLLQQASPGRYNLHDLVRAYAMNHTVDEDPPHERRAALTRLFDYFLATAAAAMDTLHPAEKHLRPRVPAPRTPTPTLTDPETAVAWLDTERPTLVAVAAYTATHGWPTHTTRLSTTLVRSLAGGDHADTLVVHGHALHAARQSGDSEGQAEARTSLGFVHAQLGHYQDAADHLLQALDLFGQAGNLVGQARALGNLGGVDERLGHYQDAAEHYGRALALYRQVGDQQGEARAVNSLGLVQARLGRYEPAIAHHEQALALYRQVGNRHGETNALINLGDAEMRMGRYEPAADHLGQALTLFRQLGNRRGEAHALDSIGILHTRLGEPDQATVHFQRALALFREIGARYGEACALNGLGETAGPSDAITHHTAAVIIATDVGDRVQQARAHTGLGHAHRTLGNADQAHHHWQQALALYTDLGTHHADQIRTHLAELSGTSPAER